jgi:hypothetical protein
MSSSAFTFEMSGRGTHAGTMTPHGIHRGAPRPDSRFKTTRQTLTLYVSQKAAAVIRKEMLHSCG